MAEIQDIRRLVERSNHSWPWFLITAGILKKETPRFFPHWLEHPTLQQVCTIMLHACPPKSRLLTVSTYTSWSIRKSVILTLSVIGRKPTLVSWIFQCW